MYNRHLNTFLQVADCGSFSKAADALYISPTAVTKQINLLEDRLGVKLFRRSFQGLALTEAGRIVYEGAQEMIGLSNSVIKRARLAGAQQDQRVRVGTSPMNPIQLLMDRWMEVSAKYPDFRLEIIPFHDYSASFQQLLERLGDDIDLFAGAYGNTSWGDAFQTFHLMDLPARIIISRQHRLAGTERLSVDDLAGETLLVTPGDYERLKGHCPDVRLKVVEYYDVGTFNHLAVSGELLFGTEYWGGLHPQLVSVPVDWDYPIHYGLIAAKEPSRAALRFIQAVQDVS